jgi:hypothetical protein
LKRKLSKSFEQKKLSSDGFNIGKSGLSEEKLNQKSTLSGSVIVKKNQELALDSNSKKTSSSGCLVSNDYGDSSSSDE